jgi:hypothetical protein
MRGWLRVETAFVVPAADLTHGHTRSHREDVGQDPRYACWIRRRLRSILRKQQKRRGIARSTGADRTRWPNAVFDGYGLISLQGTRIAARQSSRRENHQPESRMRKTRQSASEGGGGYSLPTPIATGADLTDSARL